MIRARQLRLSAGFLRELVDTFASGGVFATEDGQELVRLAADLLENALPGLTKTDAAELEHRFLDAAGSTPAETPQEKPDETEKG